MGMTGSSSDAEALVALRKANDLLRAAGWTWERVLTDKIKVVENPFAGMTNRFERKPVTPQGPTPAPRPAPQPKPQIVTPYGSPTNPISTVRNKFAGFCYCCGVDTAAQQGFLFDPWNLRNDAQSKWQVVCTPCNTSGAVHPRAAPPIRNKRKAAVSDLA